MGATCQSRGQWVVTDCGSANFATGVASPMLRGGQGCEEQVYIAACLPEGPVMGLRGFIRLILLLIVLALAGGYASAFASRQACIDDAWREVAPLKVISHPHGQMERPLARSDLEARVTAPFRVEVSWLVPDGIESTVYARKYETLPWKHRLLSSESHPIKAL